MGDSVIRDVILLGIIAVQFIQDTAGLQCKAKVDSGSLIRFNYKECSFSCCGEDDDQYCCFASKTVIIGCSIGGAFLVIVIVGAVCYLVSRSRKRRYENSIRRRPRSVSMISTSDAGSVHTLPVPLRRFSSLEVRRFSQLSGASIPSNIRIPSQYKPPGPSPRSVGTLVMGTVPPSMYKGDSGQHNTAFQMG